MLNPPVNRILFLKNTPSSPLPNDGLQIPQNGCHNNFPASNFFNYSPEKLAIHPQQLKFFPRRKNSTQSDRNRLNLPACFACKSPIKLPQNSRTELQQNTTQKWVPASNCVQSAKNFPLHSTKFRSSKKIQTRGIEKEEGGDDEFFWKQEVD